MSASSITLIPAILANNKAEFMRKFHAIQDTTKIVHVDVMDGTLVPEKTWANVQAIATIKHSLAFEIHLMVNDPLPVIIQWMRVRGFRRAIVHVESPVALTNVIAECRARCIEIVLAISPGTPLSKLTPYLKHIHGVQVMGGKPGKGGQPLNPLTLKTVRAIHTKTRTLPLAFDIGVNRQTIPSLIRAGVTRPVSGSAIFQAKNPIAEYRALTRLAQRSL